MEFLIEAKLNCRDIELYKQDFSQKKDILSKLLSLSQRVAFQ